MELNCCVYCIFVLITCVERTDTEPLNGQSVRQTAVSFAAFETAGDSGKMRSNHDVCDLQVGKSEL